MDVLENTDAVVVAGGDGTLAEVRAITLELYAFNAMSEHTSTYIIYM